MVVLVLYHKEEQVYIYTIYTIIIKTLYNP